MEALVGGALIATAITIADHIVMKKSKLVPKSVYLPRCDYTMHYLEREAVPAEGIDSHEKNRPTLLFHHGISQECSDLAGVIADWDVPPHVRILVPEQMGHGKDIGRAKDDPDGYVQPTHESMLETTSEFLDEVRASDNCNVFGISLGGAVAYYLHNLRPDKIKRAVLVSPAIVACIDKDLIRGILDGTNNFICAESRKDVKLLMRDLSTGRNDNERKKKDPVPKFFLEALYRRMKRSAPEGHFKALLMNLLRHAGLTRSVTLGSLLGPHHEPTSRNEEQANPFAALTDVDGDSHRLVIWPEKDQIISYEEGKRYFEGSISKSTRFESIPDCGHVFHADGTGIMKLVRGSARKYLLDFVSLVKGIAKVSKLYSRTRRR